MYKSKFYFILIVFIESVHGRHCDFLEQLKILFKNCNSENWMIERIETLIYDWLEDGNSTIEKKIFIYIPDLKNRMNSC